MSEEIPKQPVSVTETLNLSADDPLFDLAQEINSLIARRAYELYESRGSLHGHDAEDWLHAVSEILLNIFPDITETETELTIRADVPGFSEKDLEVRVAPRSVCITGKRAEVAELTEENSASSERRSNRIFCVLDLPSEVDPDKVDATVSYGMLEVKLQKVGLGKKVAVRAKSEFMSSIIRGWKITISMKGIPMSNHTAMHHKEAAKGTCAAGPQSWKPVAPAENESQLTSADLNMVEAVGVSEMVDQQPKNSNRRIHTLKHPEYTYQSAYEARWASGTIAGYPRGYREGYSDGFKLGNLVNMAAAAPDTSTVATSPAAPEKAAANCKVRLRRLPCENCGGCLYSDESQCPRCGTPKTHAIGEQSAEVAASTFEEFAKPS
jgi:HSP20 family molecular chaperone IbpA